MIAGRSGTVVLDAHPSVVDGVASHFGSSYDGINVQLAVLRALFIRKKRKAEQQVGEAREAISTSASR
jgi:hypothetical protein